MDLKSAIKQIEFFCNNLSQFFDAFMAGGNWTHEHMTRQALGKRLLGILWPLKSSRLNQPTENYILIEKYIQKKISYENFHPLVFRS